MIYNIAIDYRGKPFEADRVQLIDTVTNEIVSEVLNSSSIKINTDEPKGLAIVVIDKSLKAGAYYYDLTDFSAGEGENSISLDFVKKANLIPLAAVLLALYLAQQKRKKISGIDPTVVLTIAMIGAGLIGFDVIRKLLEKLGIWNDKDDKDLNNAETDPDQFWNPNYWQVVNPSGTGWSYAINEATALQWCNEIRNAFGPFDDCEECVIAVFKRCKTQANASFICWVFNKHFDKDLLSYLRGGYWPYDRLSNTDVNKINSYINKLPKF